MFKKMIALFVIFAMLVPFSSAVAADDPTSQLTIEEILNGYHEKAFAAQTAEENGGAATYARSGSGESQTLEQETVAELTAAGYEAYNVTDDNYEALEETLHTDFSEMGLDPNSSYVVVISGQDSTASTSLTNSPRIVSPIPEMVPFPNDGSASFPYTYDGTTYYMRYVTITSNDDERLKESTIYPLSTLENTPTYLADILDTILVSFIDSLTDPFSVGTIASLLGAWVAEADEDDLITLEPDSLAIHAYTAWTREYIQIWNPNYSMWQTAHCSTYANTGAYCAGMRYNSETNAPTPVIGPYQSTTIYAVDYNHGIYRKDSAVEAYLQGTTYGTYIGEIRFYLSSDAGEINFSGSQDPLFIHRECTLDLLPFRTE